MARLKSPASVIDVDFKFGRGTAKKKVARDQMVARFLDSLRRHLVKNARRPRFGCLFREGGRSHVDVPETVNAGRFTGRRADGNGIPGTYRYTRKAIATV